jgi:hypothetical protein
MLLRAPSTRTPCAARPSPCRGDAGPARGLPSLGALSTRLPATHEAASADALAALKAAPAAVNRE